MAFQRFINKNGVRRLIDARFCRSGLPEPVRSAWSGYAAESCEETEWAFKQFSPWQWWDAPQEVLFAGYGGLRFLPDDVFSYYLPGSLIGCLCPQTEEDGSQTTMWRLADSDYKFQGLNCHQILSVGWFVYYLSLHADYAYDGHVSILRTKITVATVSPPSLPERLRLIAAFDSTDAHPSR